MILRYGLSRELAREARGWPVDGALVLTTDADDVASFVRLHRGEPLAEGELLLRYRRRGGSLRLGADDFFFQEGNAGRYSATRFGELRVSASGEALLVGLRDEDFAALGPPGDHPLQ